MFAQIYKIEFSIDLQVDSSTGESEAGGSTEPEESEDPPQIVVQHVLPEASTSMPTPSSSKTSDDQVPTQPITQSVALSSSNTVDVPEPPPPSTSPCSVTPTPIKPLPSSSKSRVSDDHVPTYNDPIIQSVTAELSSNNTMNAPGPSPPPPTISSSSVTSSRSPTPSKPLPSQTVSPTIASACTPSASTAVESLEESASQVLNVEKSGSSQGPTTISHPPSVDNEDSEEWIRCAGQLEVIIDQSKDLIETLKSDLKISNTEEFLVGVASSCKDIVSLCEKLKFKSEYLLNQVLDKAGSKDDYLSEILRIDDQVPHDPGSRPATLSSNQKRYLVKLGPYQPKLSSFPKNQTMRAANDQCCFSSRWYTEYPYLEYSIVTDRAYCFVCKLFSHGIDREKSERVWIEGYCNWQKAKGSRGKGKPGKIQAHFQSNSHRAALFDYAKFCNESEHVDLLLDRNKRISLIEEEKLLQKQRDVIIMMLDISRTIARQGLAFRNEHEVESNFEQIVQLIGRHNTTMKAWLTESERKQRSYHTTYMSKNMQEEYIKVLGETLQETIVKEANDAGMIGIIADTTPDVTHVDQLAVGIRYVDKKNKPKERLLITTEVQDKTGEGMAKAILKSLSESNIDTQSVRFQTYDSAATMSGKYNGAQQKLSTMLDRPITYIPCLPHGSNLVIEHGCNASQLVSQMYDTLESCYVFFSSSTSRHAALKDRLDKIEGALQLRNLSKTRWSARPEAVEAFWKSYEDVVEVLDEIRNATKKYDSETRTKANGLFFKVKSLDFIVALMFMKNIMYKTKHMVDVLQTEELDVSGALISMNSTLKILGSMRTNTEDQKHLIEAALNFAKTVDVNGEEEFKRVHRRRKLPKRLDDTPDSCADFTVFSYYSKEMNVVLDMMISVLSSKCENLKSSFKYFSDVLDPNVTEYDSESFTEGLHHLSEAYPSEIQDTRSLVLELEIFNIHFSEHLASNPEVEKTIRSAADFALRSHSKHNLFPHVAKIFRLFLTAPPSVCKSERSFSRLKLLKTYLRSRTKEKRLHYLMLMACESDVTDLLDMQDIVDRWKFMKTRRIKV